MRLHVRLAARRWHRRRARRNQAGCLHRVSRCMHWVGRCRPRGRKVRRSRLDQAWSLHVKTRRRASTVGARVDKTVVIPRGFAVGLMGSRSGDGRACGHGREALLFRLSLGLRQQRVVLLLPLARIAVGAATIASTACLGVQRIHIRNAATASRRGHARLPLGLDPVVGLDLDLAQLMLGEAEELLQRNAAVHGLVPRLAVHRAATLVLSLGELHHHVLRRRACRCDRLLNSPLGELSLELVDLLLNNFLALFGSHHFDLGLGLCCLVPGAIAPTAAASRDAEEGDKDYRADDEKDELLERDPRVCVLFHALLPIVPIVGLVRPSEQLAPARVRSRILLIKTSLKPRLTPLPILLVVRPPPLYTASEHAAYRAARPKTPA
mmetsp:Transcript_17787/g.46559  ORF Transcript_17787/g.46559 Transcript_17787/m.46559 type:complete len:380 (-) Transcript_17787:239-1378(-)